MSPRSRFLLLVCGTILTVGAAVAYMASRALVWNERGWLGVSYMSGPEARTQAQILGMEDGQVFMTFGGSPADGRLLYRDRVLSLNGIPLSDTARIAALDARAKRGDAIVVRVQRGKAIVDVPLRLDTPLRSRMVIFAHLIALLTGLTFASIGLLVILRSPGDQRATVFFALALISALAIIGLAASVYEQTNGRGIAAPSPLALTKVLVFSALTILYPPLILHLALIFPKRRPILDRKPVILRWIYAVAALAVALIGVACALMMLSAGDPSTVKLRLRAVTRPSDVLEWLSALYMVYLLVRARKEGIQAAIAQRPFGVTFAAFGLVMGVADALGRYVPRIVSIALGLAASLFPVCVLVSFPILALVALVRSYRAANLEEKRQVAWPLWGMLIAVLGKSAAFIASFALGLFFALAHGNMIQWRGVFEALNLLPPLLTLAIPISFAVAILKYRLMNIDIIIRKTVVYAILSGAIIVMYLAIVGGAGSLLVLAFGLENQTPMIIGSTLVAAALFVPLRNKLQHLVDRNLFRHKFDYPEALKVITTESRTSADASELFHSAAEKLQQALQNRAVVIFTERADGYVAVAKVGVADSILGRLRVPLEFSETLDRPFDPRRRAIGEEASAALKRIDAELIVPAGARAFIAAAPKLSGGGYDVEDIDFFRTAADELARGIDRIRMQFEEADFVQAREIQQTLLPREMPRVAKLDVSGVWHPARTMGGDYYDLIELGEHELAICIGDVAGKGMPAALLMSGLQAAVRASASSSPRDLCDRVRRVVVSSLSGGRFVTFFYATIDTAAMRLRWCNAGHNAPVLSRADGTIVRLAEGGPAFSRLFRDTKYEERELPLHPGDRLVLFTDGVSEAGDPDAELFGEERIEELVADSSELTAEELQKTILEAARSFGGGEVDDDLTLVAVRITE